MHTLRLVDPLTTQTPKLWMPPLSPSSHIPMIEICNLDSPLNSLAPTGLQMQPSHGILFSDPTWLLTSNYVSKTTKSRLTLFSHSHPTPYSLLPFSNEPSFLLFDTVSGIGDPTPTYLHNHCNNHLGISYVWILSTYPVSILPSFFSG